jgi:hypothetical protein
VEQLLFEVDGVHKHEIVGYAECAFEITGNDNWMNERWFAKHDMRPLFVEELAVHPDYQGRGVGGFILEQLEHLARVRGCTHLVLEVAENNNRALNFYRTRNFMKLDAAIFLAKKVAVDEELLPPRPLKKSRSAAAEGEAAPAGRRRRAEAPAKKSASSRPPPRRASTPPPSSEATPDAAEPPPSVPPGT